MFIRVITFISIFYLSAINLFSNKAFGQDSTKVLKPAIFYDENGIKSSEGTLWKNKPEGYWRNYYPTGLLKSEGNRINYELSGEWKFYDKYENLTSIIPYDKGDKNGLVKSFSDSCYLIKSEPYIRNVKHGMEIEYFNEPGELVKLTTPFKEGLKDGLAKEYNRNGTIITLINYKHGFIKNKETINRSNEHGKQGTWKAFYSNGRIQSSISYKDDIYHGYYKQYDKSGKLVQAYLYIDGVLQDEDGILTKLEIQRSYYTTGQVKSEGGFDANGLEQGTHTLFSEKGEIEGVSIYINGKLIAKGKHNNEGQRIGYWEEYYLTGIVKSKGKYKLGIKIGEWFYYYENEQLEQTGKYTKEGEPNGKWVWYYDNGMILREENYRKGLLDGDFVEYQRNGDIITKGLYLDGNKEEFWFYELGDYKEEGNYRDNRKEGEWNSYYNNGKQLFTGNFIDGNPEGKHRYYYDTGVLKREEYYEVGLPEGIWKSYSSTGDLYLTTVYKNGEEYKFDNKKIE